MHALLEHVSFIAAQSWQIEPPSPHALCDVPAMHRSFEQQPFGHDCAPQSAPPPPAPALALLDEEDAPPPAPALALLDEEDAPALAPPPAPTVTPPLAALASPPEPAVAWPLELGPSSPPLAASTSKSLPSAHAASPMVTTPTIKRNRYTLFILAPPALRPC
jgi:hypothetical protein